MMKYLLSIGVAGLAFVLNPYWACTPEPQDQFQFGAEEMSKVVVGTWEGSMENGKGKKSSFTLTISRAKSNGTAAQPLLRTHCTTRSFLTAAYSCIETTEMSLRGTFSTADKAYQNAALTGVFRVVGLRLTNGELHLETSDGAIISATYHEGVFKDARLIQKETTWNLTLKRK